MSSRPIIAPNTQKPIINSADMSANITGPATVIQMLPGISYDISWTGTPTGTFLVQVSNTVVLGVNGSIQSAGTWTTLPSSSFSGTYPAPSGSSGSGFLDVVGTQAYAVRLTYTAVSGAGNLTVVAAAKVL